MNNNLSKTGPKIQEKHIKITFCCYVVVIYLNCFLLWRSIEKFISAENGKFHVIKLFFLLLKLSS